MRVCRAVGVDNVREYEAKLSGINEKHNTKRLEFADRGARSRCLFEKCTFFGSVTKAMPFNTHVFSRLVDSSRHILSMLERIYSYSYIYTFTM